MKKPEDNLKSDIKILEEKLKQQEEKNAIYLKTIEKEIEIKETLHRQELQLKDFESKHNNTKYTIYFFGTFVTIILSIITFLLNYLGKDYVDKQVTTSIESYAKPKVDSVISKRITDSYIDTLVREKAEAAISKLIIEYEAKGDTAISKSVNDVYPKLLSQLRGTYFSPNGKILEKDKNRLSEFEKALADIKTESQYTYDDWYLKGTAERQKGKYKLAIEYFTKAIRLNPKETNAYFFRGYCYGMLTQFEKALNDYSKIIELNPGALSAYNNRGGIYIVLKQIDKGLQDFKTAIEMDANYAMPYVSRGLYYKNSDNEKALADFSMAIKIEPQNDESYLYRGSVYHQLKKFDSAIIDYNKCIELNPKNIDGYFYRGHSFYSLRKLDKGIADFTQCIELNSRNGEFYHYRGNCYSGMKQYENALTDYLRATQLLPKDENVILCLTGTYIVTNKYQEALNSSQKALSLVSSSETKAIGRWQKCIIEKLLKKDTKKAESDFDSSLKEKFSLEWKLFGIEEWLTKANIDESTRAFIKQKTDLLKAKK